jgi:hypothetical protein
MKEWLRDIENLKEFLLLMSKIEWKLRRSNTQRAISWIPDCLLTWGLLMDSLMSKGEEYFCKYIHIQRRCQGLEEF